MGRIGFSPVPSDGRSYHTIPPWLGSGIEPYNPKTSLGTEGRTEPVKVQARGQSKTETERVDSCCC